MTTDIKKILDEIDGLREKSTQGEWKADGEYDWWVVRMNREKVFDDGSAGGEYSEACSKENRDYIVALQNNFPVIRDYIARLERESEAGKLLAKEIEKLAPTTDARGSLDFLVYQYHSACEGEEK